MNELEDLLDIAAVHIGHPLGFYIDKGWKHTPNNIHLRHFDEMPFKTDCFDSLDELILCLQLFCHLSCLK